MPKSTVADRRARALRRKVKSTASVPQSAHPPTWIEPQLTRLAKEAPEGSEWLHEIKYDGYRMHARIDSDKIQLLTTRVPSPRFTANGCPIRVPRHE
jgi:ATP-dependent DNA ligase